MRNPTWIGLAMVLTIVFGAAAATAEELRSEEEARGALPAEWAGVERLEDGFPVSFQSPLAERASEGVKRGAGEEADPEAEAESAEPPAEKVPEEKETFVEFGEAPTAAQLADLKERVAEGHLLDYYFLPGEERYDVGPGLTGDEVLADLKSGRFPEDCSHVNFIYGFYPNNVSRLYWLYRISGDPYYVAQIAGYADGIEWLVENRPQQFLPEGRREDVLPDPVAAIPHEPAALANFWPSVVAARLILEEAKKRAGKAGDARVTRAKQYLRTAVRFIESQVTAPYPESYGRPKGDKPAPAFVAGPTTRALVERDGLPERAAFVIEYTPWNQTFFYFATLTAAARALEDLGEIEGTRRYEDRAAQYTAIVRTAMRVLQAESDCVVRDGVPYFFHRHTPLRDGKSEMRMGHPMFRGEDTAHSGSGALNLPFLWEAGPEFGCSEGLLSGYANAMLFTLRDASATHKNGRAWPRAHIDSPWYLAASGRKDGPAPRLGAKYYALLPFASELLAVNRQYTVNDAGRGGVRELRFLKAGYFYRLAKGRR